MNGNHSRCQNCIALFLSFAQIVMLGLGGKKGVLKNRESMHCLLHLLIKT